MDAARLRASVRPLAATRKKDEKGKEERKADGKDDRPSKKVSITLGDNPHKKPSPPKPSHGAGKGLMMTSNPITQGFVPYLLTHKEHVVEVTDSVIKDIDLDPCAEQTTEKLGSLAIFDLSQALVCMKALQDRCIVEERV
ncbi:hypothetical protein SO802_002111, partial [Lithocarpus litseifolius]